MSEIIREKTQMLVWKKRPGVWSGCVDSPPPLCTSWTIFRHHQLIIIALVVDVIVIIVIILSRSRSPVITFHEKRSSVPSNFSLRTCVHLRSIYISFSNEYSISTQYQMGNFHLKYETSNISILILTWQTRIAWWPTPAWTMLSSAETSGLSVEHIFSDTANNIDIGAI